MIDILGVKYAGMINPITLHGEPTFKNVFPVYVYSVTLLLHWR